MVDNQADGGKLNRLAKSLFSAPRDFVLGAENVIDIKRFPFPEIAFWGRSNVGKSSLINGLFNSAMARVSNTPGRTRQLNFFNVGDKLTVVDMPGYGFAEVPLAIKRRWETLISTYLLERDQLKRLFLLIDARHGLKKNDLEIMEFLDKSGIVYRLVLTKADKTNEAERNELERTVNDAVKKHPAAIEKVLFTSVTKRFGIDELRREIAGLL